MGNKHPQPAPRPYHRKPAPVPERSPDDPFLSDMLRVWPHWETIRQTLTFRDVIRKVHRLNEGSYFCFKLFFECVSGEEPSKETKIWFLTSLEHLCFDRENLERFFHKNFPIFYESEFCQQIPMKVPKQWSSNILDRDRFQVITNMSDHIRDSFLYKSIYTLFSISSCGRSLVNLQQSLSYYKGPILLVVEAKNKEEPFATLKVGAYCSAGLYENGTKYRTDPHCFLFCIHPQLSTNRVRDHPDVIYFNTSNRFAQIGLGFGGTSYHKMWIPGELETIQLSRMAGAFDPDPLVLYKGQDGRVEETEFLTNDDIVDMEIFAFSSASQMKRVEEERNRETEVRQTLILTTHPSPNSVHATHDAGHETSVVGHETFVAGHETHDAVDATFVVGHARYGASVGDSLRKLGWQLRAERRQVDLKAVLQDDMLIKKPHAGERQGEVDAIVEERRREREADQGPI